MHAQCGRAALKDTSHISTEAHCLGLTRYFLEPMHAPTHPPTCLCCIRQIVAHPRVLPQLPAAQVEDPGADRILQSPVQAAGRVVLLLVRLLELVDARAPVWSAGVVMAL